MNLRRLLNLIFAAGVSVGLASVPIVASAVAAHAQSNGMVYMSMPADMPCCPGEQKTKDCQNCALVAICVLKAPVTGPSAFAILLLRHAVRTAHSFVDDAPAAGLERPPPDQPPRRLA